MFLVLPSFLIIAQLTNIHFIILQAMVNLVWLLAILVIFLEHIKTIDLYTLFTVKKLTWVALLSINLITVLERPRVLAISNILLWAPCWESQIEFSVITYIWITVNNRSQHLMLKTNSWDVNKSKAHEWLTSINIVLGPSLEWWVEIGEIEW